MSDVLLLNEHYIIPWETIDFDRLIHNYENQYSTNILTNEFQEYEVYVARIEGNTMDIDNGKTVVNDTDADNESLNAIADDTGDYHTYICHICNTSVPTIYKTAHNSSSKHRTCLKIIDTSLERARQQMLHQHEDSNFTTIHNSYYCESCSTVVSTKEKIKHETTKIHKAQARRDELLEDFLHVFLEDVKSNEKEFKKNVENKQKTNVPSHVALVQYFDKLKSTYNKSKDFVTVLSDDMLVVTALDGSQVKVTIHQFHGYHHGFCKVCRIQYTLDFYDHIMTVAHMAKIAANIPDMNFIRENLTANNRNHCILCNEIVSKDLHVLYPNHIKNLQSSKLKTMNNKLYIQGLKEKYPMKHSIEYINDDKIIVTAVDGSSVCVTMNQFNGFDNDNRCKLCKEDFVDVNEHCVKKEHMDATMTPLMDKHFLRDLGNTRGHCLLCNTTYISPKVHVSSSDIHKTKLKNVTINEKLPISNGAPLLTYSTVAKIYLPINDANNNTSVKPPNIVANINTVAKTVNAKPTGPIDGVTFCKPCNRFIDSHNFNSHANGKLHKEKVIEQITGVKIEKTVADEGLDYRMFMSYVNGKDVGCKVCKVHVEYDQFKSHALTPKHVNKYINLLRSNLMITVNDGFYCTVCQLFIHKSKIISILNHIELESHLNNLNWSNKTEVHKSEKIGDNYCLVCECKVPAGGMGVHEKGGPHNLKLQQKAETRKAFANSTLIEVWTDDIASKPESQKPIADNVQIITCHPHMQPTDNPKVFQCKICKVEVSIMNEETHSRGFNHSENFKLVISSNLLQDIGDKYHCNCCKVDIDLGKELDHIEKDVHKINLQTAKLGNKHYMIKEANNSKLVTCKLCKIFIVNSSMYIELHLDSQQHNRQLSEFLIENNIRKINAEIYSCELCAVTFGNKQLFEHLKSHVHEAKTFTHPHMEKTENIKVLTCRICHTAIPNLKDSILEHVNGVAHKRKIETVSKYLNG